ncbi:MAG: DUF3179 domain-containing (seleno)protein, partial [Tepidisphaeraceae bacterium]
MFLLPLALIVPAVLCAAVVAYGIDPYWAQYRWGVDLIMTSRRLQWPLVAATVVLVIGLLAMVIAGKRRVWWLIALLPVLALFVHRFATSPLNALAIVENPALVDGSATGAFLNDEDHVVGVVFEGNAYAYPYACLFITPVVIQQDYDQRMMIVWSAFANRALAFRIDREIKARELEIVSIPANALLLYNARVGQFINGVTGRDREGKPPAGVREALPVTKTTWARWRATHPQSRVMPPQRT